MLAVPRTADFLTQCDLKFMFFLVFSIVFAARCYASATCCHAVFVRPSVCVSVTLVNSVKTNKHIFNFFFTVG